MKQFNYKEVYRLSTKYDYSFQYIDNVLNGAPSSRARKNVGKRLAGILEKETGGKWTRDGQEAA